jgi:hypothetical protein
MPNYLILPTTKSTRIVLMPICGSLIRTLYQVLNKLDEDALSITSITMRHLENSHAPNSPDLWVYDIYMLGKFALTDGRRMPLGSIQTIRDLEEFAAPGSIRRMISSLWTFNSSTHANHPDTFLIDEENDKLGTETTAFGALMQNSLLRDVINRHLYMLGLQPPR